MPFAVGDRAIRTTWLDRVTRSPTGRAAALPVMALAYKSLRPPTDYDLVISSSHAFSRAFPVGDAVHVSYTYTPVRYVWYPETDTRGASRLLAPARATLRRADRHFARGVDAFAGISSVVAERIQNAYGREADVIFPPCDTDFFRQADQTDGWFGSGDAPNDYLLSIGRFIPYKRHDIAIELAAALGLRAVVAGRGPDLPRLKSVDAELGGGTVFLDSPSREEIRTLYQRALFTVFPPIEDFGIVPVESLACGTPVLAVDAGGAKDTVPVAVGVRARSQAINDMIDGAGKLLANLPPAGTCRDWAENFSPTMFDKRVVDWVDQAMEGTV